MADEPVSCCCGKSNEGPPLWFDRDDVSIEGNSEVRFTFDVPSVPADTPPLLWIVPRLVSVCDRGLMPTLRVNVNGQDVGPDRLVGQSETFTLPCHSEWPLRDRPKCSDEDGRPYWSVRVDDDFIIGNDPADARFRAPPVFTKAYVAHGFEASYAFDLAGLVHEGKNELLIENLLPEGTALPPQFELPEDPPRPWLSLHAEFVRVGAISLEDVAAYNADHNQLPKAQPILFDALDPAQFEEMARYYEAAPQKVSAPDGKALLHFTFGLFLRWKERASEAARHFKASLDEDPWGWCAPQALFQLGMALGNAGDERGAGRAWARLLNDFRNDAWADLARREKVIRGADGVSGLTNWPVAEAARVTTPPVLDGALGDAAWQQAPVIDGFNMYPVKFLHVPVRTEARILYDEQAVYFGFVSHEPVMAEAFNVNIERDSYVCRDDCVEVFLNPRRTYTCMYEYELGLEGGILDCLDIWDMSYMQYDADIMTRTAKFEDRWTAEIGVPWELMDTPPAQSGDVWAFNLCRVRPETENREGMLADLSPSCHAFAARESAAYLAFR